MRYRGVLLFGIILLAGGASPVPKDDSAEKLRAAYGTWTDPDKDCKYVLKGGELRIQLPKADHQLDSRHWVLPPMKNAPRVLRDVEGDFFAVVRVMFPLPESGSQAQWPYCSGGIVAWESDEKYFVIRRAGGLLVGDSEGIVTHHAAATPVTAIQTFKHGVKPPDSAFVRLKRDGRRLIAGWSRDGKKWKDFDPADIDWGAKIKVGVVAENCLGTPVEITFDQYSLTQPKK